MITASRRRRIVLRGLYAGLLIFLGISFYLNIFTTSGTAPATTTAAGGAGYRKSWETNLDEMLVKYYTTIFRDLIADGFLTDNSKTLTIGIHSPEYTAALKKNGVTSSKSIRRNLWMPFQNNTFDVQFSSHTGLDSFDNAGEFSSDLTRTLKPGGYLIIHTESKDSYSLNSLLDLFDSFQLIRSQDITVKHWTFSRIREIVLKKQIDILWRRRNLSGNCSVPKYKKELIQNAEPLIDEEPLKPRISLKRNLKNFIYLPSMVDISFKSRYIYIDVGARNYGSSIGSWFMKIYPKQNKPFKIFAIEADKQFHQEYRSKKKITLLPYTAWVRNESLFFEINRDPNTKHEEKGVGMGRVQSAQTSTPFLGDLNKIQGFDFAAWMKNSFVEKDFVVVKMDVEGTEFDLIQKMVENGAICLVDEMFLECHYDDERISKYERGFDECLKLFSSLREKGVLVHQWCSRSF